MVDFHSSGWHDLRYALDGNKMRELGWTPDATVVERLRDVTAGHYRMSVGYNPQVNDYVVWTTELGQVHKGWVYFVAMNQKRKKVANACEIYSIEIATKPRPDCDLTTFLHKRIHVCLCCFESNWHELELIKRRK